VPVVVSEKAVMVGGAVVIGLMVAVVGWKQLTAPPRSTSRPVAVLSMEKIQTISTGDEVDLAAHLPASGRTVIEFTAEW
jgi:hypothetical protein